MPTPRLASPRPASPRHPLALALAALLGLALAPAALPGCGGGGGGSGVDAAPKPQCSDGLDNDADGMTDYPDDLGCQSATGDDESAPAQPKCSDGRDNDGDGKTDFPADPGCIAANADDEVDDCPTGPMCPQCGNGKDDDANGMTDYPADPGCTSAADNDEFTDNPTACGSTVMIKRLSGTGTETGTLEATGSKLLSTTCGGAGSEDVYQLRISQPQILVATTDSAGTTIDTALSVRGAMCAMPSSELACNDDVSPSNTKSKLTVSLQPGVYYLIVDDNSAGGTYELKTTFFAGEGATCGATADCGPGLTCRIPLGGTAKVCAKPVCGDGVDDDGDGKLDFPDDPGCVNATDDDEADDCAAASPVNCPDCSNHKDDDGDGKTDYPMDTTCLAASGASEACTTHEGVVLVTQPMTMGTTVGATFDYHPTCSSSTSMAPDVTLRLDLPATTTLSLNLTTSYDSVHALLDSTCGGTAVACSDPTTMTRTNQAAGTYYLVVGGYFTTSTGTFTLNVSGKIANGASCEGALAQSGALTCGTGYACGGPMGARTCIQSQCSDAIDQDGDGKVGYPSDPGCASPDDNDETDTCPSGATCPACANGLDDDMDGKTDYPADTKCLFAGQTTEVACAVDVDGPMVMTTPSVSGTLVGAHDNLDPSCGAAGGVDRTHILNLPAMSSLTLDTENSVVDTLVSLWPATCTGTDLGCDDEGGVSVGASLKTFTNLAAGTYVASVDAYSSSTTLGTYNLNVKGTIAAGGSCEGALAQAGALTCSTGYACKGAVGSRVCGPATCNDGLDNDGDGKKDFPADPGCASASDDTEADDCPSGPTCPVCANTQDDDMDGLTDYPSDFGCAAASSTSEVFCTLETDGTQVITMPTVTGTTTGKHNDFVPSCSSTSTATDMTYALVLPVPVDTLTITTDNSAFDTVLSVQNSSCSMSLACNDESGATLHASKVTLTNVAAGVYAVTVDGYQALDGAYFVNTKGIVASGTACTSPLFAAGVLVCPAGQSCNATSGKCAP